jgi:anti-sigma B factor antagonist
MTVLSKSKKAAALAGTVKSLAQPLCVTVGSWAVVVAPSPASVSVVSMEFGLHIDDSRAPYTVLAVKGEVDVYTAPRLREKLVELVSQGKHQIVVDLEGVDFLDSTGLGVLVGALKRLRSHGGDLKLVCSHQRILKVFEITGLTKVFSIVGSLDEAGAQ